MSIEGFNYYYKEGIEIYTRDRPSGEWKLGRLPEWQKEIYKNHVKYRPKKTLSALTKAKISAGLDKYYKTKKDAKLKRFVTVEYREENAETT